MVTDIPGLPDMTAADFSSASYRHVIGDKLVERFVSQVQDDPEMRDLVDVCAVVRTFDHDVVRAVWGRTPVDEPMRRLRRYSFVHVRADGRWSLNQVVREFLDQGLRRRSISRWTDLNHRAASFYQDQATTGPRYSGEWNWLTLESLYHQLRLDEDEGILRFASLFDEAKNLSRYDFCSELLNNVQDVKLTRPYSQHWLTYYRGVMSRVHTFAWDEAYASDQELYDQADLPPALRARVTTDLGRYHYQIVDRYDQAIAMLNESLRLRQDLHDEQGQAHVLSHLAVAQASASDVNGGRESGLACVRLAERLDAPYRLGWGYYSLGVVETYAGDYAVALDYFHHSLAAFEAAGYEFGPGVVHYQMGHVAIATGELDTALEHFQVNLQLMQKYDTPVLTARTMVDMCEVHLAQCDTDRLRTQAIAAERLILDQANHAQLARLRLVQAEMVLRQLLGQPSHPPGEQRGAQDQADTESALVDVVADRYLDALLSAAQASVPTLRPTVQQIEGHMERLVDQDRRVLVQTIVQTLVTGVDQALEGTLARHGQLIVLPEPARQPLRTLDLSQRWAHL